MGGTYTYTYNCYKYGLTDISAGSGSFNSLDWDAWDAWDASEQGSNGNKVYSNGGYGIEYLDSKVSFTQSAEELSLGEAIKDVQSEIATDVNGNEVVHVINNYKGTAAVTKTLSFNAVQTISSGASVSIGYSDTTPVDVGAEVSAEFEAIGASVNASITNATTIDSSSASGTKAISELPKDLQDHFKPDTLI